MQKIKIENFLLTSYFEVAPPCHTVLTTTIKIYYKKISLHPNLFYSGLKIFC